MNKSGSERLSERASERASESVSERVVVLSECVRAYVGACVHDRSWKRATVALMVRPRSTKASDNGCAVQHRTPSFVGSESTWQRHFPRLSGAAEEAQKGDNAEHEIKLGPVQFTCSIALPPPNAGHSPPVSAPTQLVNLRTEHALMNSVASWWRR